MANRAAGKGYENENFYENIKFQFCGIENIHGKHFIRFKD
jgi:myotubularin-related protein 6/7/8